MNYDLWIDLKKLVYAQHKMQVKLSFDRHLHFMRTHGLNECQTIVDLGTGEGKFLKEVAKRTPQTSFYGVDKLGHMIAQAKTRGPPPIKWVRSDAFDRTAQTLLLSADGILMRYFVLHLPKTRTALPLLLKRAKIGARLWIFDIDTENCKCDPREAAYDSLKELVQTFCDKNEVEIRTESRLPAILESAGFQTRKVSVEPFNNQEIEPNLFAEYLFREALLYAYHLTGKTMSNRVREIGDFLNNRMKRETHFVQYGMTMISAQRPPFDSSVQEHKEQEIPA